jgi:hypothetical protein
MKIVNYTRGGATPVGTTWFNLEGSYEVVSWFGDDVTLQHLSYVPEVVRSNRHTLVEGSSEELGLEEGLYDAWSWYDTDGRLMVLEFFRTSWQEVNDRE